MQLFAHWHRIICYKNDSKKNYLQLVRYTFLFVRGLRSTTFKLTSTAHFTSQYSVSQRECWLSRIDVGGANIHLAIQLCRGRNKY